jgi:2-amino-4-hydroxy-6-hydroxymethyldihydropteridine diphosphokinase
MERAFLGLGSNLGDRLTYLRSAVEAIRKLDGVELLGASSVYETEPVGPKEQPVFYNMAVTVRTSLDPDALFRSVKSIEKDLGRKETIRWGPREIDIDLLYFGSAVISRPDFHVPHQEIVNRNFVLVPLAELDDSFVDPLRQRTIKSLLAASPDRSAVKKLDRALSTHQEK